MRFAQDRNVTAGYTIAMSRLVENLNLKPDDMRISHFPA